MMPCQIICSRGIPDKYVKWTKEILSTLGPEVSYGQGGQYHLIEPISAIYLLTEQEYGDVKKRLGFNSHFLESGYEPSPEAYNGIASKSIVDLKDFYGSITRTHLDVSIGCWGPTFEQDGARTVQSGRWSSVVLLCTDRIRKKAGELRNRVPEVKGNKIERCLFRIALYHEVGHHFTFGNFGVPALREALDYADLNIFEGLANWFAYMHCTSEERWVQAEIAVDQKISYRYYLFFKHADITKLLDCFLAEASYAKAPVALTNVIGGRMDHNGRTMTVGGSYDGVAMDWSGKGATIIAKENIKALGTMNAGCFITPRIDLLIGRFPKNVLIVTNKIVTAADYGELPSNIIVLPRDKVDLEYVINTHLEDDELARVRNILVGANVLER